MSIIRVERNSDYSVISNVSLRDSSLSWGARGLLAYLLTKPDSWVVRVENLITQSPGGRNSVRTIIKELENAGYLTRKKVRQIDGTYVWESTVHESPKILGLDITSTGRSSVDGSSTGGPTVDIVSTDLVSTEKTLVTKKDIQEAREKEAVSEVFEYYLQETKKQNPYSLTPLRMSSGLRRLRDATRSTGSTKLGLELMCDAVDALVNNKWMMGANPQQKKYCDWLDHLFGSAEVFEKRLAELERKK